MKQLNMVITRMVKDWITGQKLSQSLFARRLQLSQPQLSKRLAEKVPWKLSEIDALEAMGVIDYQRFSERFKELENE